jgi:hypothetical protein
MAQHRQNNRPLVGGEDDRDYDNQQEDPVADTFEDAATILANRPYLIGLAVVRNLEARLLDQVGPLRRFVQELERHPRITRLVLDSFRVVPFHDDGNDDYDSESQGDHDQQEEVAREPPEPFQIALALLDELFGNILPGHSSLLRGGRICLLNCDPRFIRLFASKLPSHDAYSDNSDSGNKPAGAPVLRHLKIQQTFSLAAANLGIGQEPLCASDLAAMLKLGGAVQDLTVFDAWGGGLDSVGCQELCNAVPFNRHLRGLDVAAGDARALRTHLRSEHDDDDTKRDASAAFEERFLACAGTFDSAIKAASTLEHLVIRADWTADGFNAFVEELKTNEVLTHLDLFFHRCPVTAQEGGNADSSVSPIPIGMLVDVLTTYNWTLRQVRLHPATVLLRGGGNPRNPRSRNFQMHYGYPALRPHQERIDALLRRNENVRRAHGQLQSRNYHVASPSLLPAALAAFGGRSAGMPTPVYRLLRRGNVGAFVDHLQQLRAADAAASTTRAGSERETEHIT